MPIQIGQPPGHDFDEPLGLLSDCHRRIEHFIHVLVVVDHEAAGGPLTPGHRRALEASLRYFAVAAPKHTADEEESLFPRLRDSPDPAAAAAMMLVDRLEHEHDQADGHHAAVAVLVQRWLAEDRLSPSEARELRERLAQLQVLYQRHIMLEDEQLFPAAARMLGNAQLRQIGREMADRRQIRSDISLDR
ncbi:MAG TPA: hemerythrin domain-containing protein [Vicinamibacterales bacterium]|nr:hemerythrin domain-containing protein [Vicinamibacterales bacterium]